MHEHASLFSITNMQKKKFDQSHDQLRYVHDVFCGAFHCEPYPLKAKKKISIYFEIKLK